MIRIKEALALAALCLSIPAAAQQRYIFQDVENGSRLYRTNCFVCHGPEGASIPGVDFRRGQFKRATTDQDLFKIIAGGIPGTAMPPTTVTDSQRLALVAYLRSLHDAAVSATGSGNAAAGKALFEGKGGCIACHRVNGKGSVYGPDLSEVGAIRTAAHLEGSVVNPNAEVLPEQRGVRAVTKQGATINGRRLNEDTHTIQLIDQNQRLHSLSKADLRDFTLLTTSAMQSYKDKLSAAEVADLVTYLLSLKGLD